MKTIEIKNMGPVTECKIDIKHLNVITGKQSAGKSTIAKCLYFFLSIPDELDRLIVRAQSQKVSKDTKIQGMVERFKNSLKNELYEIFGMRDSAFHKGSFLKMEFTDTISIRVSYGNAVSIYFSKDLRDFLEELSVENWSEKNKLYNTSSNKRIHDFFRLDCSPVYIPAGRSVITVLGNQFEYFYSTMDDGNKGLIDLCSRRYYEIVMGLKPLFGGGFNNLIGKKQKEGINKLALTLMNRVMKGEYYYLNGAEYILLKNGESVNLNKASSGQQEVLWIYNILIYYTITSQKKFYIIEEPESNLFPESQQIISRFLGLISNQDNPMLINTHSPYVLGELNNMLYAAEISRRGKKKRTYDIVPKECQLQFDMTQSLFVEEGKVLDCMDYDIKQIDNSKLDAISNVINEEYEELLKIEGE